MKSKPEIVSMPSTGGLDTPLEEHSGLLDHRVNMDKEN